MSLPIVFAVICVVGGLLLVFSVLLSPSIPSKETQINRRGRIFFVLLRLAIGWHFLVSGLDKMGDPLEWINSRQWSSQGYLHSATGPLGPYFREIADEEFLSQLDVDAKSKKLPPALANQWDRYFEAFKKEMILDPRDKAQKDYSDKEKGQINKAKIKLDQAKVNMHKWMTTRQMIEKPSPYLSRPIEMNIPDRVAYYKELMDKSQTIATVKGAAFGEGAKKELAVVLNEARGVYADLKRDIAEQTNEMKKDLATVLDDPVRKRLTLPNIPPPPFEWKRLQTADLLVPLGLCVIGICLVCGFFTRINCLAGAAMLLMFYLAMPPLPGWPVAMAGEGRDLYINKNIIEMLALLGLATTRSGLWLGVDGLLRSGWGLFFGKKTAKPQGPVPVVASENETKQ